MDNNSYENIIPANIIKLLQEKSLDKRQLGGQRLKDLVKTFEGKNNEDHINKLIFDIQRRLISTQQTVSRKAGIYALLCVTEQLIQSDKVMIQKVLANLMSPILKNISINDDDKQQLMIYEGLIQMCKLLKTTILMNFNEIFDKGILYYLKNNTFDKGKSNENNILLNAIMFLDQILKQLVHQEINEQKIEYYQEKQQKEKEQKEQKDKEKQLEEEKNLNELKLYQQRLNELIQSEQKKNEQKQKIMYFKMHDFMKFLLIQMDQQDFKLKQQSLKFKESILGWIKYLNCNFQDSFYQYFPQLLKHLFDMLSDSQVRVTADNLIMEFLKQIEKQYNQSQLDPEINNQIFIQLIEICRDQKSKQNFGKLNAMLWIYEYLRIFNLELESQFDYYKNQIIKGQKEVQNEAQNEVQRVRSNTMPMNTIIIINEEIETPFRKELLNKLISLLDPILQLMSHEEEEIRKIAFKTNELMLKLMDKLKSSTIQSQGLVMTVINILKSQQSKTVEEALKWMKKLLEIYPEQLSHYINNEEILSELINKLNDSEMNVVSNVIEVLAGISLYQQTLSNVIEKILIYLSQNKETLEKKGEIILKKICSILDPKKVYFKVTAKLLELYSESKFDYIGIVVQTLTTLLIAEQELQTLRNFLRNLKNENDEIKRKKNITIFETFFKTFCYHQISVVTLCLLSEEYELAYNIILSFQEIEITYTILSEVSHLIKVLELPVFVFLRLQLLEYNQHPFLVKCLFGLMMLLPKGDKGQAYDLIQERLTAISQLQIDNLQQSIITSSSDEFLDIEKMVKQFRDIRQQCLGQKDIKYQIDNHLQQF